MKQLNLILFLSCLLFGLKAQELEKPLSVNIHQHLQYQKERGFEKSGERGMTQSLELPFVDDFSRFSFPTDDPNIPESWQRWDTTGAYFNETMAEFPPTIGVATLDGLKGDGFPYDFNATAFGPADTLTSLPIDISEFDVNSDLYLSFYYQEGGYGNAPELNDSLIVEFYTPDADAWFKVWDSEGGSGDDDFDRAFIKVEEPFFFRTEFRFRFRNYASLAGNLDHWNIDYVILDENIDPEDFDLIDVGFVHPQSTLLNLYTAMPWTHFIDNPASHMAQSVEALQGNLNNDRNIVSGYRVEYEGIEQFDDPDLYLNTTGNGFSTFESEFPVSADPGNYVYDSNVNDTCAFFDVKLYTNTTPDENRWNDTLRFTQEFTNFYAYDDGSAERAYALENAAGGQVAVRFQTAVEDSLLGLFIHFTPFEEDVSGEIFLLRAWADNNGIPGPELGENFNFNYPIYYTGEPNIFGYYEYDNPIPVDGVFYVGYTQNSSAEYNLGLDKQGSSNTDNLFFKTSSTSSWSSSSIQGSVMIRPVFASGKSEVWNSVEEEESGELLIYPNPTTGRVNVEWEYSDRLTQMEILDLSGRVLDQWQLKGVSRQELDLSSWPKGLYFLRAFNEKGNITRRQKILLQ